MSTTRSLCRIRSAAIVLLLTGCSETVDNFPYDRLSLYAFFEGDMAALEPADGVIPYEVASQLWADGGAKHRFIRLPPGTALTPTAGEDWEFPIGAVVIKNFSFPNDARNEDAGWRNIETRLLIREADGWTAHVYLWNAEQTEAVRFVGGKRVDVSYIGENGPLSEEYVVPNTNQCGNCHARDDAIHLLGVIGPQLERQVERDGAAVDQLSWLSAQGLFGSEPPPTVTDALTDPYGSDSVEKRARSWLHANCAHCHRPGGNGGTSGLTLLASETEPFKLGVCKSPAAAGSGTGGHEYDVVPGVPDDSIMPFRIASVDPEIKMPELPNRIPDARGLQLIQEWIAAMTPTGCN